MKEEQLKLAAQHFAELPDPRVERSRQHPLVNIIVIALCAVISDAESFYEIEEFGQTKQAWLAQFLNLENGIPSHDTFNRVFARLNPTHFQACFLDWVREAIGGSLSAGDVLAIDGKSLRGSGREEVQAVHMLNVWSHQHGLCLTSTAVDGKTNEITMLPGLLDTLNLLDIADCTITVDALHTQRETARKLLEYQAAYVLALKENQPKLHEDVVWLFEQAEREDEAQCVVHEQGRGREETRQCVVRSDLRYLEVHAWPGLKSVAKVTCERLVQGRRSLETRYYLCGFEADAARVLCTVRAHWEVENKLHWVLDVVFGEDAHSYALDHGPQNMAVLRQFALNLLKKDTSKGSLKGKRKRAAWNDEFRATLLQRLIEP